MHPYSVPPSRFKTWKYWRAHEEWHFGVYTPKAAVPTRGHACMRLIAEAGMNYIAASIVRLIQQQQQQQQPPPLRLPNTSVLCTSSVPPRGTGELALEVIGRPRVRHHSPAGVNIWPHFMRHAGGLAKQVHTHIACQPHAGGRQYEKRTDLCLAGERTIAAQWFVGTLLLVTLLVTAPP
jgi:hypothetical protein